MKVAHLNTSFGVYSKKRVMQLFKKGEEIEVEITGVQPFGAFGVIIVEGVEYTTLIHKSIINPNDKDVEPERHFRYGDKVKGVIQDFDNKGNMSLSTIKYFDLLPDYFEEQETKIIQKPVIEEMKQEETVNELALLTDEEAEAIYNQVKPTLETTLPVISAESEQMFKQLIKEAGVVEFCLSLGKIAPTFNIDPGLLLAEAIHNDIRGCL